MADSRLGRDNKLYFAQVFGPTNGRHAWFVWRVPPDGGLVEQLKSGDNTSPEKASQMARLALAVAIGRSSEA